MIGPVSGAFPKGYSFMAILELTAGVSPAPRKWWADAGAIP